MNCTQSDENDRRDKTVHGRPRRWFGSLSHARPRREYVEGANGSFHIRASQAEIFSEWANFPFKLNRYNGFPRGAGMSNAAFTGRNEAQRSSCPSVRHGSLHLSDFQMKLFTKCTCVIFKRRKLDIFRVILNS